MKSKHDILIIGGGLAGLTSAIHLAKAGVSVTVVEPNSYPKHKVCGEYLSNEVLPYLNSLGFDPFDFGATKIDRFQLSSVHGRLTEAKLPLGGFGSSRYILDQQLAELAKNQGAQIIIDKVVWVEFFNDWFKVTFNNHESISAKMVIGAFGKRSNLDIQLNRSFIENKSPYLAVKAHYYGDFPNDLVAIHNFKGGLLWRFKGGR